MNVYILPPKKPRLKKADMFKKRKTRQRCQTPPDSTTPPGTTQFIVTLLEGAEQSCSGFPPHLLLLYPSMGMVPKRPIHPSS